MVANPFVRLFVAPVETLTLLGYVLGLLALTLITVAMCVRNALTLHVRYEKQRPAQWQYVPPLGWLLRLAAIPFVLAVDVWAVGAVIALIT